MGFQSKKTSSCLAMKLENFTAPKSPKNNAARLATSIIKPFVKPFKNPKAKARVIIKSRKLPLLK